MKGEHLAQWIAGALAVLAVAATLDTVLSAPRHRERLARKEADLRRIEAYANRWAREDALRADLERRQAWTPANLDELAVRALGVGAAKISPRPATPAAGGWLRREVAVELRNASYGEVALFLASAAEAAPAWRLRALEIAPAAEAGRGAATLTLETLEKPGP